MNPPELFWLLFVFLMFRCLYFFIINFYWSPAPLMMMLPLCLKFNSSNMF